MSRLHSLLKCTLKEKLIGIKQQKKTGSQREKREKERKESGGDEERERENDKMGKI